MKTESLKRAGQSNVTNRWSKNKEPSNSPPSIVHSVPQTSSNVSKYDKSSTSPRKLRDSVVARDGIRCTLGLDSDVVEILRVRRALDADDALLFCSAAGVTTAFSNRRQTKVSEQRVTIDLTKISDTRFPLVRIDY